MPMKKVLVIDDDSGILYIVSRWLQSLGGLEVSTAETGTSAMQQIEGGEWDLVVSDVFLPDNDGLTISKLIKSSHQHCPVLLMTGHLNMDVAYRAINSQIQGLLQKPLKKNEFLSKVQELLDTAEAQAPQRRKERVLAIGAHPDDVEIGCGGILLKHRDEQDEITILTLSNGERGGQVGIRAQEANNASNMLGAQLFLKDLQDTQISANGETIAMIESVIQEVNPTIIYTHTKNDNHQDHRNTHLATIVAARKVRQLECYQSPSSTIDFRPSRYVDITEELDEKIGLVACYASQFSKCDYLSESLIHSTAEYWGRYAGYRKVEPLEVVRRE